jgi:putative oxidoreductase
LVRPAAAVLAFTMLVAIFAVHIGKGFFAGSGGYEYALALFAASVSLLVSGAGRLSLDRALSQRGEVSGQRVLLAVAVGGTAK